MVVSYTTVKTEGEEEHFFEREGVLETIDSGVNTVEEEEMPQRIPEPGANGDLREEVDRTQGGVKLIMIMIWRLKTYQTTQMTG